MAAMTMNRVIHAAFRRDLARFETALDTLADGDKRRAAQLGAAWANFHEQLTIHHTSEHNIAWPALRKVGISDELITQMDAEHDRMATALKSADDAVQALQRTPSTENIRTARQAISTLRATATEHLDHEEAEFEQFFLSHEYNDDLKAMGRQMGRAYKPAQAGAFFAWLQDGAGSDEKAALRQNVPAPVVMILDRLFGGTYRRTIAPVWR